MIQRPPTTKPLSSRQKLANVLGAGPLSKVTGPATGCARAVKAPAPGATAFRSAPSPPAKDLKYLVREAPPPKTRLSRLSLALMKTKGGGDYRLRRVLAGRWRLRLQFLLICFNSTFLSIQPRAFRRPRHKLPVFPTLHLGARSKGFPRHPLLARIERVMAVDIDRHHQ